MRSNKTPTPSRESVGALSHFSELLFTLTSLKVLNAQASHLYAFKARTKQNSDGQRMMLSALALS